MKPRRAATIWFCERADENTLNCNCRSFSQTVSMDLPFAQKRFCGAEGIERVITASDYKHRSFGVLIKELGLLARAVFVLDRKGKVVQAEYVPEITKEPNYDAALAAVKTAL